METEDYRLITLPKGCMVSKAPFLKYGLDKINRFNFHFAEPRNTEIVRHFLHQLSNIVDYLQTVGPGIESIAKLGEDFDIGVLARGLACLPRDENGMICLTSHTDGQNEEPNGIILTANNQVLPDVGLREELSTPIINSGHREIGIFHRYNLFDDGKGIRNYIRPVPGMLIINAANPLLAQSHPLHPLAGKFNNLYLNVISVVHKAQMEIESGQATITPNDFRNILDWVNGTEILYPERRIRYRLG